MTLLKGLRAVRELLAVPERWTQGVYARDVDGGEVTPYADDAVCWCLRGGVKRVAGEPWTEGGDRPLFPPLIDALTAAANVGFASIEDDGWNTLWVFNDLEGTTHPKMLAVLDRAIATAEAAA